MQYAGILDWVWWTLRLSTCASAPSPSPPSSALRYRTEGTGQRVQDRGGVPDPDPDPPDPQCFRASRIRIRIFLSASKNSKKNLDSYCFVTSFRLFIFEKWCKFKSNKQKNILKNCFLLASWRSMTKIAGSGSISQKHESADLDSDPNPHQNVMDTEHWKEGTVQRVQDWGYTAGHLCIPIGRSGWFM